jgi:hypothetical protein
MKRIILAISVIVFALNANAQQDSMNLIFNNIPKKISGFAGPTASFTAYNGQFSFMSGGGASMLINDFFVGAFGLSRQNELDPDNPDDFSFTYGGVITGYSILGDKAIHPLVSLSAGWGNIKMNDDLTQPPVKDQVWVLTPTAEVEVNIFKFVRASAGITYNYTMGVDIAGLDNLDFSNLGGTFSVRFGFFTR